MLAIMHPRKEVWHGRSHRTGTKQVQEWERHLSQQSVLLDSPVQGSTFCMAHEKNDNVQYEEMEINSKQIIDNGEFLLYFHLYCHLETIW